MAAKPKSSRQAAFAPVEFNHAMIHVRDLAPTLHFYADLLGFKIIEQFGPGYARLKSPRGQGSIACPAGSDFQKTPPMLT